MAWFKCSACGYLLRKDIPPEECPSCKKNCSFIDTTCYTPECGGSENIDPRIAGK